MISVRRQCLQFILVGALGFLSYLFISHYVLQSVQVVGTSMWPTLRPSDRCLLNHFIYLLRNPQPTDIVVIRDPSDNSFAVKRIVAGAGDTVRFTKTGQVLVNGRLLKEPYLSPGTPTFANLSLKEQSIQCGGDQYLVLGDNRNNSIDSRIYGPVPRQNILGVVVR